LKAKPLICLAKDAVINKEGGPGRIDHWVNKMCKLGGSRHMKIDKKLKFLYENGRKEQVGMYLRNQNLKDISFPDSYKLRSECERIHAHIKNTVKFDVRRVRKEGRELYSKINLVTYQLLLLTNLQNHINLQTRSKTTSNPNQTKIEHATTTQLQPSTFLTKTDPYNYKKPDKNSKSA